MANEAQTEKPNSTIAIPLTEELSRRIAILQTAQQIRTGTRPSQGSLLADLINGAYERNEYALKAALSALEKVAL